MRRGFEVLPTVCWSIETLNWVDWHTTSTLEIGRVYSDVIIKPPSISFTLYWTQGILYDYITLVDVSACVDMNKCWDKLDEASVTQAVHSLFYSYGPEWRQHFKKNTILAYLYHLSNKMTINEPKLSFIYLKSMAWHLVVCGQILGQIAILWNFSRHLLENVTRSQKNKTVTFKDCILWSLYQRFSGTTTCLSIAMI